VWRFRNCREVGGLLGSASKAAGTHSGSGDRSTTIATRMLHAEAAAEALRSPT
jgi:hypothetical protein